MKIVLSGYYGMSNYGDDLFSVVASQAAKKYWPKEIDVKVMSPQVKGCDCECLISEVFSKPYEAHSVVGSFTRATFQAINFYQADKVVFAGGSLFTSGRLGSRGLTTYFNGLKGNLWALGVSVGPFKNISDEVRILNYLKRFEFISTRDTQSYNFLKANGFNENIVDSADLAGLFNTLFPAFHSSVELFLPKSKNEIQLGFSPCLVPYDLEKSKYYCDIFLRFVQKLTEEKQVNVSVICLNQHPVVGDLSLSNYVISRLNQLGIKNNLIRYKDNGVLKTWRVISQLDFYVSVRLHGAITAFMSNVKFYCFEYHQKSTDFLDFIGLPVDFRYAGEDLEPLFKSLSQDGATMLPCEYTRLSMRNFTLAPLIK